MNDAALLLAPVGRDAALAARILGKAGLAAEVCADVAELCAGLPEAGAAVVAEEALTPDAVGCVVQVLERQPSWSDLPFVILTGGGGSTAATVRHAHLLERLGHVTLIERPLRAVTLVTAVRAALRSRSRQYELRDRMEAVVASERQLRSIFEHAAVGVCVIDRGGTLTQANEALAEIVGYTREELEDMAPEALTFEEDRPASQQMHRALFDGTRSSAVLEQRCLRRDGSVAWVRVSASAVPGPAGKVDRVVALVEEITARKQAEEALSQQASEMARSNADLQQFAYVTSHDLREPLRSIRAFAELLQKRYAGRFDADADQALCFIADGAVRMELLVRDLLAYSRTINPEERAPERVRLADAVEWARNNVQVRVEETGALVEFSELPEVLGDRVLLVQLFQNLLSNAMKYVRPGVAPVVRIDAEPDGAGWWTVRVRDNGMGIDPRFHERIFGLFKRLHGREIPGTGIGLAICRKIVERHGGQMWVDSQLGQGATFCFTLPAAER